MTGKALRDRRDAQGAFLELAAPQMDSLFGLIGRSGCGVLLTDAEGVVLELRCAEGDAQVFRDWGCGPARIGAKPPRGPMASAPVWRRTGRSPFTGTSISWREISA